MSREPAAGLIQGLFGLDGRVAVVTGSAGLLGPIWMHALMEAGASVLAIDRAPLPEAIAAHAADRVGPGRLISVIADVRDRSSLEAALETCVSQLGVPDILVNNAGIDQPPDRPQAAYRLEDIPFDVSRDVFDVNTLGAMLAMQVFGGRMAQAGRGAIVNIASLYASVAPDPRLYDHLASDPPFLKPPAYGASKAALVNLTRAFAVQWATRGVRVNALSPGGVRARQDERFLEKYSSKVPLGRMAGAEDLWGPLLFLVSSASSYVTGFELVVDGGFTAW